MLINSHADLFSYAAYQCLQQESVSALSRLGSGGQVYQTSYSYVNYLGHRIISGSMRCRYSLLSSKILLAHSSHALRNAPINSQLLFDNRIREAQHRYLASSANNPTMQPQKSSCTAIGSFRKPR